MNPSHTKVYNQPPASSSITRQRKQLLAMDACESVQRTTGWVLCHPSEDDQDDDDDDDACNMIAVTPRLSYLLHQLRLTPIIVIVAIVCRPTYTRKTSFRHHSYGFPVDFYVCVYVCLLVTFQGLVLFPVLINTAVISSFKCAPILASFWIYFLLFVFFICFSYLIFI